MEPVSIFLSSFIELVDRIINLEKTKLQDKKTLFNEIIKPLFEELEPVATNYIEIFRKARKASTVSCLQELEEAIKFLSEERRNMYLARTKVEHMANQIEKSIKDEEVNHFAKAVGFFFFDSMGYINPISSRTRTTLMFLRQIVGRAKKIGEITERQKGLIAKYIDSNLASLEQSWNVIVESYVKLKIYSVSPPNYVKKSQIEKTKSQ